MEDLLRVVYLGSNKMEAGVQSRSRIDNASFDPWEAVLND